MDSHCICREYSLCGPVSNSSAVYRPDALSHAATLTENPPACILYYLTMGCKHNPCAFCHDYEMTPEQRNGWRMKAASTPCSATLLKGPSTPQAPFYRLFPRLADWVLKVVNVNLAIRVSMATSVPSWISALSRRKGNVNTKRVRPLTQSV